jgi:hypothetical protein
MSVYNRRPSTVNLNQLVTNIPVRRKAADQVERDNYEWSQVYNYIFLFFLKKTRIFFCTSVAKCFKGY